MVWWRSVGSRGAVSQGLDPDDWTSSVQCHSSLASGWMERKKYVNRIGSFIICLTGWGGSGETGQADRPPFIHRSKQIKIDTGVKCCCFSSYFKVPTAKEILFSTTKLPFFRTKNVSYTSEKNVSYLFNVCMIHYPLSSFLWYSLHFTPSSCLIHPLLLKV